MKDFIDTFKKKSLMVYCHIMKILFYRYGSICEPDMIETFRHLGLEVTEECTQISKKNTTGSDTVEALSKLFKKDSYLFVFSVNFFPAVSEICKLYNIVYVSWTVDSPVIELFSPSLANSCNRTFYFDRAQYERFSPANPEGSFHLPLATNPVRWQKAVSAASPDIRRRFTSDISFVGSLYKEKDPYLLIKDIPPYASGYINGLKNAQTLLFGVNIIEPSLNDKVMSLFEPLVPDLHTPYCENSDSVKRYIFANSFIGSDLAWHERLLYLNSLAKYFDVDLYTGSDTSELNGVHIHSTVKTLTEMPLVFNLSRINLNITTRSIQTGLSLRNFDICGCGGFLMTNYQEELPELYEPGTEAEYFSSEDELVDKCAYYLEHEDERAAIAQRGYERTVSSHSYEIRIAEMIRLINSTI